MVVSSPPSSSSSPSSSSTFFFFLASAHLFPKKRCCTSSSSSSSSSIFLLSSASLAFILITLCTTLFLRFPLYAVLDTQSLVFLPNSSASLPSSISKFSSSDHILPSPPPPPSPVFVPTSRPPILSQPSASTSAPLPQPSLSPSFSSHPDSPQKTSHGSTNSSATRLDGREEQKCDLFKGEWVRDEEMEVLYRSETCPILTQTQDCRGNGRPDNDYEKWRWQPAGGDRCHLPPFHPLAFLSLLRGKTLAFVGDSVARNHMESLVCMLWQVEEPMNRGSKKMQRWYFRSYDVTVIRIWSSWLVNATEVAWDDAPANLTKLKLEEPDPNYMEVLPKIDILVISSGHWFAKRTAYIMGGEVVGGQQWSPKKKKRGRMMKKVEAFAIAMRTAMKAILEEEGLKKGVVVLRTFSPDHYEGGAWDGGGSCTGKTRPALVVKRDEHTELMRKVQLEAFQEAIKIKNKNKVELKVLDVTRVFETRPDGHPGPYRNRDPNKITSPILGPHGHLPPPQDCLHWCMPGPIDTWSHLLLAILSSST